MKPVTIRLNTILLLAAMLAFPGYAQAGVECNVSSGGFSTAYGSTLNITAASFTVTCTKTNGNPKTATYQLAVNGGLYTNRAFLSPSYLNYNLTSDSGCTAVWNNTSPNYIPATAYTTPTLTTTGQTDIKTYSYYGCVPAGQTAVTSGTYTDTVTMSFIPGGPKFTGGTFPVSIVAPSTCSITTAPGNITFSYTSFSATDVLANTTLATTCTNSLPYTLSLDATTGTVVGVNYSLLLNTAASGGSHPLNSTGNGVAQTFYINGTVAAGQAGTCAGVSCSASNTHTLTVTY